MTGTAPIEVTLVTASGCHFCEDATRLLQDLARVPRTRGPWAPPFRRGAPALSRPDSAGVYTLGVFSGAASACCAPVLAGMLTLSALSPSLVAATGIGLAYVFGM